MKRNDLPVTWVNEDKSMLAVTFQDTGKVHMLSTVGNPGETEVQVQSKSGVRNVKKPNVIILYNKFMGGADKFDQLCST